MKPEDCPKIDDCYKIQIVMDKDILDFQAAEAIRGICGRCEEVVEDKGLLTLEAITKDLGGAINLLFTRHYSACMKQLTTLHETLKETQLAKADKEQKQLKDLQRTIDRMMQDNTELTEKLAASGKQ